MLYNCLKWWLILPDDDFVDDFVKPFVKDKNSIEQQKVESQNKLELERIESQK